MNNLYINVDKLPIEIILWRIMINSKSTNCNRVYLFYIFIIIISGSCFTPIVLADNTKTANDWVEEGESLNNAGRYSESLDAYNNALLINPNYTGAWINKGNALSSLGRNQDALDAYNNALSIDPNNAIAWMNKGNAFLQLGRNQEALDAYNKALLTDPNDEYTWINKGVALNYLGRYSEALDAYNKALLIDPNNAIAWRSKGEALNSLGRYSEALDAFNKSLSIDPNDTKAWNNKGVTLHSLGRYSEALDAFNKSLSIDPNNTQPWINKGATLAYLDRYQEALDDYNKALSIDPNIESGWINKGLTLFFLGRNQEALDAFNEALLIYPNDTKAWNYKGVLLVYLTRDSEALDAFNKSLSIDPNNTEAQTNKNLLLTRIRSTLTTNPTSVWTTAPTISIPTPIIYTSNNTSNSGNSNVSSLIIVILVALFLAGGGYAIYQIKKKLSGDQSPEKEAAATLPHSLVSRFTPKHLTPKQPPAELADRYTDWEFIGKGGFARVFKAKRKDGQYVAVKIPITIDESTGKSFISELQNWTRLDHPNIVKVFNFNIMPSPYFEMELCDSSLADRKKPIEIEEAAWILLNVCEGLKFTHAQKIIHRDLKPQNILLKNGVPKISDWGLSRVISESTSTIAASFTPYYAAPEQIGNKTKDERTDIWQLGVIFYELVTGVLPFTGDSMVEVMAGIATKNQTPPSVINPFSNDVEAMIIKCLEKNPSKRYQSVPEFQKDLALYLRITYTESLKMSVTAKDYNQSAYYCGDLVMVNLLTGDMTSAYKYLLDLVNYAEGDVKTLARELSEQIKIRIEMGVTEIPDELVQKAEIIVHKVRAQS